MVTETMIFRKALDTDIPMILALQTKVFCGEQKIPAGDIREFLNRNPMLWCAAACNTVVGTAAAWEEAGALHWGRFAVEADCRGQGIGRRLARLSFDDIFAQGFEQVYMEAREVTAKMVCAMGGRVCGETVPFYVGTITPVVLKREDYLQGGAVKL